MSKFSSSRAMLTSVTAISLALGAVAPVATAEPKAPAAPAAPAPAPAAPAGGVCTEKKLQAKAASFEWKVSDTWLVDVLGAKFNGDSSQQGGVTRKESGVKSSWTFKTDKAEITGQNKVEIPVQGGLTFKAPKNAVPEAITLESILQEPMLKIEGKKVSLTADSLSRDVIDDSTPAGPLKGHGDVVLATWDLKTSFKADKKKTFNFDSETEGKFTKEGMKAFGDYSLGSEAAAIKGSVEIVDCEADGSSAKPTDARKQRLEELKKKRDEEEAKRKAEEKKKEEEARRRAEEEKRKQEEAQRQKEEQAKKDESNGKKDDPKKDESNNKDGSSTPKSKLDKFYEALGGRENGIFALVVAVLGGVGLLALLGQHVINHPMVKDHPLLKNLPIFRR